MEECAWTKNERLQRNSTAPRQKFRPETKDSSQALSESWGILHIEHQAHHV